MSSHGDRADLSTLRASLNSLQAQNAALRQLVAIHDRLGALVLQGASVSAITRMMAELVGRRVLLLDALLQVQAMALPGLDARDTGDAFRWTPAPGYVRAVLATMARERRPLRVPPMADLGVDASAVLAPVAVGDSSLGYLAILAEGDATAGEDLDLQIVQHAATVYALSMMRERMTAEVARQLRDDLFEGLLLGRSQDEQVARERAVRLGYKPASVYRVLVLTAFESLAGDGKRADMLAQRRRLLESLAELCARRSPDSLAAVRDEELVVLVAEPTIAVDLGRTALQHAATLLPGCQVTAGIGATCASAGAIARSYAQARRAIETAQRFGHHGDVMAFEDLGVYRLLFQVSDADELRGFTEQVLGTLIDYDRRHNADFVRTLAAFLANNGNVQATARQLSLHVNSVAYRLQRIQSVSSLDLEQSEDRLLAQVALKILNGLASQ